MKKLAFHIFIIGSIFFSACKKDKIVEPICVSPPKPSEYIQMKFIFVNKGDASLKAVNLESSFYRITLNSSRIVYKNYPTIAAFDSIVHYTDSSKIGGQKKFDIQLFFYRADTIYKRLYFLSTLSADTLKKASDGIELFRWPQDTIKYIKTYQWP